MCHQISKHWEVGWKTRRSRLFFNQFLKAFIIREIQSKGSPNFMIIRITHPTLLQGNDFLCSLHVLWLICNFSEIEKVLSRALQLRASPPFKTSPTQICYINLFNFWTLMSHWLEKQLTYVVGLSDHLLSFLRVLVLTEVGFFSHSVLFICVMLEWQSRNNVHGHKFLEKKFASVRYLQGWNIVRWWAVMAPEKKYRVTWSNIIWWYALQFEAKFIIMASQTIG